MGIFKEKTVTELVVGKYQLSNHSELYVDRIYADIIELRFAIGGKSWSMRTKSLKELVEVLNKIINVMENKND